MATLITNARIFDGTSPNLIDGMCVLVEDNKISRIEPNIPVPAGATTLDAGSKTLIPGLIDAHWHTYFANVPISILMSGDMSDVAIAPDTAP